MIRILSCSCTLLLAAAVSAETPFQLGVPSANVPDDPDVSGMRISFLHGKNQSTSGLDIGLLSLSETERMSGVAFVGGVHKVNSAMEGGAAFSLINFHTGRDSGFNGAFVNVLNDAEGFNTGFIIIAQGRTLVDLGGVNVSKESGIQIGFVNVTERIETFQFGFLNMAENGFLPIFPVFNFPAD